MVRVIIHLDLDAFFCGVEEHRDTSLHGLPFAVGGQPDKRGVVASCSYAARKFGVRSAMPMSQAVRLCPDLIIVRHHFDDYRAASRKIMEYLNTLTPLVEQISIDEAFLDVTGERNAGKPLAETIQHTIQEQFGLPCSMGVASNKLVAKIANNIGKSTASKLTDGAPNAINVIPHGNEANFFKSLPIRELWGIGPKTAEKLHAMRIYQIGDLTKLSQGELKKHFGKLGEELFFRARGIDDRPVETNHDTKSISKELTFEVDVREEAVLLKTLRQLADGVGRQVRKQNLQGKTVSIKLRWSDFTTITRQITLPQPIDSDAKIYQSALEIFHQSWSKGRPIRLIGVALSGFENPIQQLSLWDAPISEEDQRLQNTLDALKDRFGESMIKRASDLE
ncbi:MAG: DNA polymerase IV [Aggregatilineales bacterium]